MVKNIINHIFIYTLLMICVSCSDNILGTENECLDCVLELSIPELNIDSNDYYHLDYNDALPI
jgi:hypothetical protein